MAKYLDLVGLTAYNNKLKTVYPKNISYGNYTPTAGGNARKGFSYQIDVESNNTQTTNTVTIVDVSTLNSDLPTFTAPTDANTPGVKGLVPGASYANIGKFLKADGTWDTPADRYVDSALFADDTTVSASSPVKMTLTRAGSDTQTVTANIPKVSDTSAGVAPKGASVSTQSQTTKFLREDGTWQAPSYTTAVSTYSSTGTEPVNGTAVAAALATLPSPMVFKGTLGTGGTITALPINGTATIGDTYKVITADTYTIATGETQAAVVGDLFTCLTKTSGANTWTYIPSGDETYTDTWRGIKVNNTAALGSGISTGDVDFVSGVGTTTSFNSTGNKIQVDAKLKNGSTAYTEDSTGNTSATTQLYAVAPDKSGYLAVNVPWTDTHYASNTVVAGNATATSDTSSALTNGNVYVNHVENGAVTGSYNIQGTGGTTVTTDANADILVNTTMQSLGGGYGECSTAASTDAKTVAITGFTLQDGALVSVKFTNAVTVTSAATLNINSTGAKNIYYNGAALTSGVIRAGDLVTFKYDATNTRYDIVFNSISDAEINTLFTTT